MLKFQFTLPRGERRPRKHLVGAFAVVSIHAPAWGATTSPRPSTRCTPQFQFTLPRGERLSAPIMPSSTSSFNSRSRVGSDTTAARVKAQGVSFNSRSRVGSDGAIEATYNTIVQFQFTLPRGERLRLRQSAQGVVIVSIHAPAWGATRGERLRLRQSAQGVVIVSIHAPAWGATCAFEESAGEAKVSIHAPAWGATQRNLGPRQRDRVSIHAPAWGAT